MDLIRVAFDFNSRRSLEDPHTDAIDKFSSKYMVIFLAIAAVLVSADIYIGNSKPLECWVPEDFGKSDYVAFILDYCYLNNTRYVAPDQATYNARVSRPITYYQWTGFILILLIGIYVTPTFVWKALHRNLDISMIRLVQLAEKYNISASTAQRQEVLNNLTSNLVNYLARQNQRSYHHHLNINNGNNNNNNNVTMATDAAGNTTMHTRVAGAKKSRANYHEGLNHHQRFATTFLAVKIIALVCPLFAILILCLIFGKDYTFFAARFLYILAVEKRIDSEVFPLETFCDIRLYVQSKTPENTYSLPCMLVNNVFTIFIFSFLNVLQWIVVLLNAVNLVVWLERLSLRGRKRFIESYLYSTPVGGYANFSNDNDNNDAFFDIQNVDSMELRNDNSNYNYRNNRYYQCIELLKPDGAVILHLLSSNASDFVVAAIVREMCRVEERTRFEAINEPDTDAEEIMANMMIDNYINDNNNDGDNDANGVQEDQNGFNNDDDDDVDGMHAVHLADIDSSPPLNANNANNNMNHFNNNNNNANANYNNNNSR